MRVRHLLAVVLGALPACNWVSQADLDARAPMLDDDNDGYPQADDCNDNDAAISPAAAELWYDGVDQDCKGDDDYDADSDSWVADEHLGLPTTGVEGSGGLTGGDCNDDDSLAFPGAGDAWYDGMDRDCSGDDDYDQDGDGYVPVQYDGLPTQNAPGTGVLPSGDCDDTDPGVNATAVDTWYDGVDTDCDGQDDWDQDGDGYYDAVSYPDYDETQNAPGTGTAYPGDCDDTDPDVYTNAIDAWYDGVDSDCAGEDDYDQDNDGFVGDADAGLSTLYVDGSGQLAAGDCDDEDEDVRPGATETMGDATDQDCDGSRDGFALAAVDGLTWSEPRSVQAAFNDDYVFVSTIVSGLGTSATNYVESGVALYFDAVLPKIEEYGLIDWLSNKADPGYVLGDAHDFRVDDDQVQVAVGWRTPAGSRTLYLGGYELGSTSTPRSYAVSTSATAANFASVALVADQDNSVLDASYLPVGNLHAIGCEATTGTAQLLRANPTDFSTNYLSSSISDFTSAACTLHFDADPTGQIVAARNGGVIETSFDREEGIPTYVDGEVDTSLNPYMIDQLHDGTSTWLFLADASNAAVVVIDPSGGLSVLSDLPDARTVTASWTQGGEMLLCAVDDIGASTMLRGHPDTGWDAPIPMTTSFPAETCSAQTSTTGGRLLGAAVGGDELALGIALIP
jgi:Putative metal-binding motif